MSPSRVADFSARSARATALSSSTMGWPFLTVSPLLDEERVNVPFDRGSQGREFFGDRFRAPQAFDGSEQPYPALPLPS